MQELVDDIGAAIRAINSCGVPLKQFQCGVGPYGEPQLTKLIARHLSDARPDRYPRIRTCRVPDVLVPERWALEFKIVRPFGDNGVEAEHWSQNLLHPYPGNISAIGDTYKLLRHEGSEKRGIIAIGYEHKPPKIDVSILVSGFEILCRQLLKLPLGDRHTCVIDGCVHPVHQCTTIYGWRLAANG